MITLEAITYTSIQQEMQFASIMDHMTQNNIVTSGMPFTIYNEMNTENGHVIMSNAIPTRSKVNVEYSSEILCGYITKTKVLKTTLNGNYSNLPKA